MYYRVGLRSVMYFFTVIIDYELDSTLDLKRFILQISFEKCTVQRSVHLLSLINALQDLRQITSVKIELFRH